MKIRIIVMNGQRIVQREESGKWLTHKVEKAVGIKPGIYNVYLAAPAEKRTSYEGIVVHADNDAVYQQIGRGFVSHDKSGLDRIPVVGGRYHIQQGNKKTTVAVMRAKQRVSD